jgi:hypothetical protein
LLLRQFSPKDAEFIVETRTALDADEIPGPFADLVSDYLGKLAANADDLQGNGGERALSRGRRRAGGQRCGLGRLVPG